MAYRLGVDVGGTFTDLFLVDDEDHRQWRVKTPSTPSDPSQGVLGGVRRICEEAGIGADDAAQRRPRHDGRHQRGARVQGRARRPHHHAGLRPDPAPRPLPDAWAAGRLDHHDQARSARLARRHARGDRAHGRAREHARPGRPRAGRRRRARPDRLGRRVADDQPHQRLRRRPPRARDRRDRRGDPARLPGHDLLRGAAGVPRVRAHADRVHELVRAADRVGLRRPAARVAARARRGRARSTSCARTRA